MSEAGRIADTFARCRSEGRAALVGYLTAFDPDREGSIARAVAACEAGVDVLELGVAFSDPTADGPEIQAAMLRALAAGSTLDGVLEIAAAIRERCRQPIVLFSYANPLLRMGPALAVARAREAGIDGLLVVDFPPESAAALRDPARAAGLDWIGLCAPTSTPARRDRVAAASSGFVYAVSLTGVTGAALDADSEGLAAQLEDLRGRTALPIAVGFGVREPEQVRVLAQKADGVVVGSALVRAGREGVDALASRVRALAAALGRGA
jgi:tryptophan synthase alpha chain